MLAIHIHVPLRAPAGSGTSSQCARKKPEVLFAALKNQIGLRRLRLRRMKFVREQFFPAAGAPTGAALALLNREARTVDGNCKKEAEGEVRLVPVKKS